MDKQEIHELFPETNFPEVRFQPLHYGRRNLHSYEGKKAIVDMKDPENPRPFAICSDDYKLTTHEEIISELLSSLEKLPEYGKPVIIPTMINGGAKMEIKVGFPEVNFEIAHGDDIFPQAFLKNSYDLQWKLSINYGAKQLVCSNGLRAYKSIGRMKSLHRQNLSLSEISKAFIDGMASYSEQVGLWKSWAQRELNRVEAEEIMEALPFGEKYNEKILSLPKTDNGMTIMHMANEGRLTKWGMYSIVTQFLTHEVEAELVQIEKGQEVAKVFTNLFN